MCVRHSADDGLVRKLLCVDLLRLKKYASIVFILNCLLIFTEQAFQRRIHVQKFRSSRKLFFILQQRPTSFKLRSGLGYEGQILFQIIRGEHAIDSLYLRVATF